MYWLEFRILHNFLIRSESQRVSQLFRIDSVYTRKVVFNSSKMKLCVQPQCTVHGIYAEKSNFEGYLKKSLSPSHLQDHIFTVFPDVKCKTLEQMLVFCNTCFRGELKKGWRKSNFQK